MRTRFRAVKGLLAVLVVSALAILSPGPSWAHHSGEHGCKKHGQDQECESPKEAEDAEQDCPEEESAEADSEDESGDQEDADKKNKKKNEEEASDKGEEAEQEGCDADEGDQQKACDDKSAEQDACGDESAEQDDCGDGEDAEDDCPQEQPSDESDTTEGQDNPADGGEDRRDVTRETTSSDSRRIAPEQTKSAERVERGASSKDAVRSGRGTMVLAEELHRSPQQRAQVDGSFNLTITPDSAETSPGDAIRYSVVASYEGDQTLTGVVITAEIPAGTTYLASSTASGDFDEASGVVQWTYPKFAPGQSVALTFDVSVPVDISAETLVARVSVEGDQLEAQSTEVETPVGPAGSTAGAPDEEQGNQGSLARTGSDPRRIVALALVMIAGGTVLVRHRGNVLSSRKVC